MPRDGPGKSYPQLYTINCPLCGSRWCVFNAPAAAVLLWVGRSLRNNRALLGEVAVVENIEVNTGTYKFRVGNTHIV